MIKRTLIALVLMAPIQAWAAQAQNYDLHMPAPHVKKLNVQSSGGQVKLHASREQGVRVKGTRTMGDATCKLTAHNAGDTVTVTIADAAGAPCRIDVDVAVSPFVDATLVSEEGNVFVSGMRQALSLTMTRGNAVVGGSFSALHAHLMHGSLSAQGVGAQTTLNLEEGNAQLWLDKPAPTSKVALDVGTGNVTLTVPVSQISVNVSVAHGEVRNPLEEDAAASIQVTGQIGHGNLTLREMPKSRS
jgi:hypothetical protein